MATIATPSVTPTPAPTPGTAPALIPIPGPPPPLWYSAISDRVRTSRRLNVTLLIPRTVSDDDDSNIHVVQSALKDLKVVCAEKDIYLHITDLASGLDPIPDNTRGGKGDIRPAGGPQEDQCVPQTQQNEGNEGNTGDEGEEENGEEEEEEEEEENEEEEDGGNVVNMLVCLDAIQRSDLVIALVDGQYMHASTTSAEQEKLIDEALTTFPMLVPWRGLSVWNMLVLFAIMHRGRPTILLASPHTLDEIAALQQLQKQQQVQPPQHLNQQYHQQGSGVTSPSQQMQSGALPCTDVPPSPSSPAPAPFPAPSIPPPVAAAIAALGPSGRLDGYHVFSVAYVDLPEPEGGSLHARFYTMAHHVVAMLLPVRRGSIQEYDHGLHDAVALRNLSEYCNVHRMLQTVEACVSARSGERRHVAVVCDSGCGKTALLSAWRAIHQRTAPQDFIVFHSAGVTAESRNLEALVQRLCVQFGALENRQNMFTVGGTTDSNGVPGTRRSPMMTSSSTVVTPETTPPTERRQRSTGGVLVHHTRQPSGGIANVNIDISYKWSDITLTMEDFYFKKGEVLEIVDICSGYYSEVMNSAGAVFAMPSFYLTPSPRDPTTYICTSKYTCRTDEVRFAASVEQGEAVKMLVQTCKDAIYIVRSISRDVQGILPANHTMRIVSQLSSIESASSPPYLTNRQQRFSAHTITLPTSIHSKDILPSSARVGEDPPSPSDGWHPRRYSDTDLQDKKRMHLLEETKRKEKDEVKKKAGEKLASVKSIIADPPPVVPALPSSPSHESLKTLKSVGMCIAPECNFSIRVEARHMSSSNFAAGHFVKRVRSQVDRLILVSKTSGILASKQKSMCCEMPFSFLAKESGIHTAEGDTYYQCRFNCEWEKKTSAGTFFTHLRTGENVLILDDDLGPLDEVMSMTTGEVGLVPSAALFPIGPDTLIDVSHDLNVLVNNTLADSMNGLSQSLAARGGKLIVVIDNYDKLRVSQSGQSFLELLPDQLPHNMVIVTSSEAMPDPSFQCIQIPSKFSEEERVKLAEQLCRLHKVDTGDTPLTIATSLAASARPLFLTTLLKDIKAYGREERPDAALIQLAQCRDVQSLFTCILQRMDTVGDEPLMCVIVFLQALYLSQDGMRDEELHRLVTEQCPDMAAYFSIDAKWRELVFMLRPFLIEANGWYALAHESIADCLQARYRLNDARVVLPLRMKLARLFLARFFELSEHKGAAHLLYRCVSEFAHHMHALENAGKANWRWVVDGDDEVCDTDDLPLPTVMVSNIIRLLGAIEKHPSWLQRELFHMLSISKVVGNHRRNIAEFSAKSSDVRTLYKSRSTGYTPPSSRRTVNRRTRSLEPKGSTGEDAGRPRKTVRFVEDGSFVREELETVMEVQ